MSTCCAHTQSASRLFSFFARNYCKRFKKKGLENSQKQIISHLESLGLADKSILEIGCGVGQLHMALLDRGAGKATGVDLSPKMLIEAKNWSAQRGLSNQTQYIVGDFIELAQKVDAADITLLDKVICCYPDVTALLENSLQKTNQILAVTYPKFTRLNRMFWRFGDFLMWTIRSGFRGYVYPPELIENLISAQGFEKRFEDTTMVWLTQVYVKSS